MSGPSMHTDDGATSTTHRLAAREVELLAELVARLEHDTSTGPTETGETADLVRRVIAAADPRTASRRLRLVSDEEQPRTKSPQASPKVRTLALGGALVAAAAALCVVVLRKQEPIAQPSSAFDASIGGQGPGRLTRSELVLASGEVFVGETPARVGSGPLEVGARIHTGQGRACLSIDPHIDVCLGGESEIVLHSLVEERTEVRVVRGVAVAALAHRQPGQTFSLLGDDVSATAKGTVFALQRDDGRSPAVVVLEGAVEVTTGGSPKAMVVAHTRWARDATSPDSMAVGRSEEGRFLDLLAARPLWHPVDLGIIDVHGAPGEARIDGEVPLKMPFQSFVPAGSHQLSLRSPSGEETNLEIDVIAGQTRGIDAASLLAAPRHAVPLFGGPGRQELLADARRQLESGQAAEALRIYRKIERDFSTSAEATMVLVTIGKLEMRQGSPTRALAAFDGYLRRGGPLAPEAYKGRIDALHAMGKASEERSAIETYLARYPDGFDIAALKKRLAVLSHP